MEKFRIRDYISWLASASCETGYFDPEHPCQGPMAADAGELMAPGAQWTGLGAAGQHWARTFTPPEESGGPRRFCWPHRAGLPRGQRLQSTRSLPLPPGLTTNRPTPSADMGGESLLQASHGRGPCPQELGEPVLIRQPRLLACGCLGSTILGSGPEGGGGVRDHFILGSLFPGPC